ncbi:MAG: hypothetical protein P8P56_12055 [Yoonia sp.]|nr:hypothetical protein [Yoonia sp.]MDG1862949.1 hypothetical protein [Yoonia sp.]
MQMLNLSNTKKAISGLWHSVTMPTGVDRGYVPYEREPVKKSEISEMLALHYRKDDPRGYSQAERREYENLAALRDILYPPSAA